MGVVPSDGTCLMTLYVGYIARTELAMHAGVYTVLEKQGGWCEDARKEDEMRRSEMRLH